MYNKNSQHDWLTAGVTAALGAGIVTTFAVSQGQNPFLGLGITVFAAGAALAVDQLLRRFP
ncbi:MAG: hypothetical protein ACFE0J_16690 [Elainellaceae cyanobacterium]